MTNGSAFEVRFFCARALPASSSPASHGTFPALGTNLNWELFPLFWKNLAGIDALELIAHRHIWSLVNGTVFLAWLGGWRDVATAFRQPALLGHTLAASALLTAYWLVFVWGGNHGHVIECSLGYFLSPLANVLLGRFVLSEHLSVRQALALALALHGAGLAALVSKGRPRSLDRPRHHRHLGR